MTQTRRKTAKTATRQKKTSGASSRKLRDLDERDPSKVKGGMTSPTPTTSSKYGGVSIGTGRSIVPCV